MKKLDLMRGLGFAGLLLGGVATLLTSWVEEQKMKETVREEVNKALTERENEEES